MREALRVVMVTGSHEHDLVYQGAKKRANTFTIQGVRE